MMIHVWELPLYHTVVCPRPGQWYLPLSTLSTQVLTNTGGCLGSVCELMSVNSRQRRLHGPKDSLKLTVELCSIDYFGRSEL